MSDVHEYYSTYFTDITARHVNTQYPIKRQKYGYVGNLDGFNLDPVQYRDDVHMGDLYEYYVDECIGSHKSVNLKHTNIDYSDVVEDSFERANTCGVVNSHTPSVEPTSIEDSLLQNCTEQRISDDMIICDSPIYDGVDYTLNTFTNHTRALVSQAQHVFNECCEDVKYNIYYYEESCVSEQNKYEIRTQLLNDICNINEWLNNVVNDEYNAFFGNVMNILTLNYIGYPFRHEFEIYKK